MIKFGNPKLDDPAIDKPLVLKTDPPFTVEIKAGALCWADEPKPSAAKFDRNAYQREYMRKVRAAKKSKA